MAKSVLKFSGELYQPTWKFLRANFTEAELRREYSRLRDIAQKRLGRLGESEFGRSWAYMNNVGKFPKLSEFKTKNKITSKAKFAKALAQLAHFVESPQSTLSGQREIRAKTIETLHGSGYTFVNEKNFFDFLEFMEEFRIRKLDEIYDSERATSLARAANRRGIDPRILLEEFEYFKDQKSYLSKIKLPKDKSSLTADDLKNAIEDYKAGKDSKKK